MSELIKTPVRVEHRPHGDTEEMLLVSADGMTILRDVDLINRHLLAELVRILNVHDQLVAACEAADNFLAKAYADGTLGFDVRPLVVTLRAALSAAPKMRTASRGALTCPSD